MQALPSMNGKSRERLSLDGMAAHIANATLLIRRGIGTKNDWKLAIAFILRAYHQEFTKKVAHDIPHTPAALDARARGEATELEHAIPVGCIMNVLYHYAQGDTHDEVTKQVNSLIVQNTILARVTPDEHAKLNAKHQASMPTGFDTYPWKDVWARYVASGVPVPGEASYPESLNAYFARHTAKEGLL